MEFIEAGLLYSGLCQSELRDRLSFLERIGIRPLIFHGFSELKAFKQQMEGLGLPVPHLNILSSASREPINMIWDIIQYYESFTVFIKASQFSKNDDLREALYQILSFTDNVGCSVEITAISIDPMAKIFQMLNEEFQINRFLIQDSEGLVLPDDTRKYLAAIWSKVLKGSQLFYSANDQYGLALINSLYAMPMRIHGLVGSALGSNNRQFVDLLKLHLLYQHKKANLFSNTRIELLNQAFDSFLTGGEEKHLFWRQRNTTDFLKGNC